MNYTVKLKDGKDAIKDVDYTFNEETKIFYYINNNLVIDFSNYNDITFVIYHDCILKCGDNCTIRCGSFNQFYLGKNCLIQDCGYIKRNNIIYKCGEKCKVELHRIEKINDFYIPINYPIKTNCSKTGFEIIK